MCLSSAYLGAGAAAPAAGLAPGMGRVAFCCCLMMASGLLNVASSANVTRMLVSVLDTRFTSGNQQSDRSSGFALPQPYCSAPAAGGAVTNSAPEVKLLIWPPSGTALPGRH